MKQAMRADLVCLARCNEDGPVLTVCATKLEGRTSLKSVIIYAALSNASGKRCFEIPECVFAAVEVVFTEEGEEVK